PDLLPLIQEILPGCGDAVLDLQAIIHCPLWKKHQERET
ncbi:chemotaxis protein, partial [Fischerella thermalis WC217]